MADLKISQLNSIVTVVPATDVLPVVQGGTTLKITPNQILGAGGTATLASATITGAATVGTTLGVTGASTLASATVTGLATVGTTFAVGTVTPDIFGRFYTRSIGFDSSGSTMLQINGTSYGGIDLGAAGVRTFGITSSASDANISTVTNIPMIFNINSSTKMTLNTAGNLAFPTGKGIDFSAVTGGTGTATANVLNDYEEGTWTPSLGGVGVVYATQTGQYTKIGNLVFIKAVLVITTIGTGSTTDISGLPFTNKSGGTAGCSVSSFFQSASSVVSFFAKIANNGTTITVASLTAAGTTEAANPIFQGATQFQFSACYNV